MKKTLHLLCALTLVLMITQSCKKSSGGNDSGNGNNFSDSIRNIVPQAVIDSLRSWGMQINDGLTPPTVSGIYFVSPDSCEFDNSGDNTAGRIYDPYKFRFKQQSNSKLTISVDRKDVGSGSDSSSDSTATFIAGSGNHFTIFAVEKGIGSGVSYTNLELYSGEITSSGIVNFQYSIYVKDKGSDPLNRLISVGRSRIFTNADGPAMPVSTYSIEPNSKMSNPESFLLIKSTSVSHPGL
jgi:hypothetical protein